jgi:hypothetical protein
MHAAVADNIFWWWSSARIYINSGVVYVYCVAAPRAPPRPPTFSSLLFLYIYFYIYILYIYIYSIYNIDVHIFGTL